MVKGYDPLHPAQYPSSYRPSYPRAKSGDGLEYPLPLSKKPTAVRKYMWG